jgi:hypothetical protein
MLVLAGLFMVPTAVYFLMRYTALSRPLGSEALYPLGPALATMPLLTAKYLALLFIPSGYSYQHLTPFVDSIFTMRFLGPAALIAIAAAAVLWTRSRLVKLAAAWFAITLAPALYAVDGVLSGRGAGDRVGRKPPGVRLAQALCRRVCIGCPRHLMGGRLYKTKQRVARRRYGL